MLSESHSSRKYGNYNALSAYEASSMGFTGIDSKSLPINSGKYISSAIENELISGNLGTF